MFEREGGYTPSSEEKFRMSEEEWRKQERQRLNDKVKGAVKSPADRKTGIARFEHETKDKEYLIEAGANDEKTRYSERPIVIIDKDVAPRKLPARGKTRRETIEEGIEDYLEIKEERPEVPEYLGERRRTVSTKERREQRDKDGKNLKAALDALKRLSPQELMQVDSVLRELKR